MGNGIVNGKTAKVSIYGAVVLLGLLIVAVTVIVVTDKQIPEIFVSVVTLLVGFLVGTRTVSDDVKQTIIENERTNGELKK